MSEYFVKYFPYEGLVMYEIGVGNGPLAIDVLDLIRSAYPEVCERTHYNIVEINDRLAKLEELLVPRHPCVSITDKSIFHWDRQEPAPCFFQRWKSWCVIRSLRFRSTRSSHADNFCTQHILLRKSQPGSIPGPHHRQCQRRLRHIRHARHRTGSFINLLRRLEHPPPLQFIPKSPSVRSILNHLPFALNLSPPK